MSMTAPDTRLAVLLPLPLAGAYDYVAPAGLMAQPGQYVRVPLGNRYLVGIVWDSPSGDVASSRLKPIEATLDLPPMPQVTRRFIDWVAAYTLSPPGAVLKMALSVPEALEPPRSAAAYRWHMVEGVKPTPARQRIQELLADGLARPAPEIAKEAGVGPGAVRDLIRLGALAEAPMAPPRLFQTPDLHLPGAILSPDQRIAADDLRQSEGFSVTLLDGVTGSGKTEVYFEAIAAALQKGRQVLVLLPEIALSAQWLERFKGRFGVAPAVWHSEITPARRRDTWRAVASGEARLVVGARSALFLPYPDLGLIVVDEEHDQAFKQEEGVIYHARDMAVVRAHLGAFPCILASATPSLETAANARQGRYKRLHLAERHGSAELPLIKRIDLRKFPPRRNSWLSEPLVQALGETLKAGEQSLLFLNRRGYAPLTLCRACGYRFQCPNCTAWMVEHRSQRKLVCHHCGHALPPPDACPSCHEKETLVALGPGVERLAEEAVARFPEARVEVMASDLMESPRAIGELVGRMERHEIDILIGTQMVAKGHHFPQLTLVGVVDADLGLEGGDLRAGEKSFQLLWQVAGRAGRAEKPGRVFLQTWQPDHPVMAALASGDIERFLDAEADARNKAGMPPFGRLAGIIVSSPDPAMTARAAHALAYGAPRQDGVDVLGPAPAPLALLRGRHRARLLVKAAHGVKIQTYLRAWLAAVALPKQVRIQVDVDPVSFF
ncbi:Primosomal protein N' [Rhodospirillaceae bacterium LM-1]|nr:Primosomal protein N' [Rhodospirillaceae bacterium LM-1]